MNVDLVVVFPIFYSEKGPANNKVNQVGDVDQKQKNDLNDRILEGHS